MTVFQHAWVVVGLRNLLEYARLNEMPELLNHCQLAYGSALEEIGGETRADSRSLEAQRSVDALRELVDYTETVDLPKTRNLLLQALASAASHLDNATLSGTLVPFPVRPPH